LNSGFKVDERVTKRKERDSFPSVGTLIELKKRALRRRVWFRFLNRVERGIIDLTVRYVDCIKSTKLAKLVTAIIEKLQTTKENIVDKLVRTVGLALAQKISNLAVSWGNLLACMWANELEFAKFLVVNHVKV
jgi:hypothetical protein